MNHLRPPSGFVFVLCFVSEGGGEKSQETVPCLSPEYQFRGRVPKHWGYSLRPRGDSGLRAAGGLRRAAERDRLPAGSPQRRVALRGAYKAKESPRHQSGSGAGAGRGSRGVHVCTFPEKSP